METQASKKAIEIVRERLGGVSKKLREFSREQARIHRKIRGALKGGAPRTVPEIRDATDLPADVVFWHLMAMKHYGEIVEGEERDSYYEYALKQGEKEKERK